jgi:hypothetical protein
MRPPIFLDDDEFLAFQVLIVIGSITVFGVLAGLGYLVWRFIKVCM